MQYPALDPTLWRPAVRLDSSSAFRYGRSAHLAAVASEATKTSATTLPVPRCPRADYLDGFAFRQEFRRRGLSVVSETFRPRRRAHVAQAA